MEINQYKQVKVDVKTLKIYTKVTDRFCASLHDSQGDEVFFQEDGYVPNIMPGDHYGDYIILNIDLETGKILNWEIPSAGSIEEWIKEE